MEWYFTQKKEKEEVALQNNFDGAFEDFQPSVKAK